MIYALAIVAIVALVGMDDAAAPDKTGCAAASPVVPVVIHPDPQSASR